MAKVLRIKTKGQRDAETSRSAGRGSERTGARIEKTKTGKKGAGRQPSGKFIGKTSGLGVTKYQNQSIENNRKRRKTDEQLAAEWRAEFPGSVADYEAATVRSVRNLYNKGKHGNDKPAKPVPEFDDAGDPLPFWGEKGAAKRRAKDDDEDEAPRRRRKARDEDEEEEEEEEDEEPRRKVKKTKKGRD